MSDQVSPIGISDGPSQDQINEWKAKFGEAYLASFSKDEKYIYRPLRRLEYKQMMSLAQQQDSKAFIEEKVAQSCILWPTMDPTKLAALKAGTISTIVELIMTASNFGIQEEPIKL
jgi:hypothetical protein